MTPDETDSQARNDGPGRLLRNAREKAGMTLRDVSAQLHLDEHTLASLEADDFATLPAPAFVRGYLRGYARMLGVPVGPVMEAYDRENFAPPDLVADISEKPQANSADFPVRLTTWVVVLVLVGLVMVWWNNQSVDDLGADAPADGAIPSLAMPDPPPAAVAERVPAPADAMAADSRGDPAAGDVPAADAPRVAGSGTDLPPAAPAGSGAGDSPAGTAARPPAVTGQAADAPAGTVPDAATGPGTGPGESGANVQAGVDRIIDEAQQVLARSRETIDAVSDGPSADAEGAAATPAGPAAAAAPRAPPGAEPGTPRLRISFPVEAWVEIYDADGGRLFYNLVKPGRELDLSGPPPIRVLLGRTDGVTVEYDGEPVDLAPYTERGVARFTVGE